MKPTKPRLVGHDLGPPWWQSPAEFLGHVLGGTLIFGTIAGAAVLLDVAIRYFDGIQVSGVILLGLKIAEYALFGVDLALFLIFVGRAAFRLLRRL